MNLQNVRISRNIEQAELAKRVGTNAPMMSNFEHYKCIPIPGMLKKMCEILNCRTSDIYENDEIYINVKKESSSSNKEEPSVYKLTVNLPNSMRELLTPENLKKCGYRSLKDFILQQCEYFRKRLEAIEKKSHYEKALRNDCEDVKSI